jgi:hypothetical protein
VHKHRFHATFTTEQAKQQSTSCRVHSYASQEKELANSMYRGRSLGGVRFGDAPRPVLSRTRLVCPVHSYAAPPSSLRKVGGSTFGTAARPLTSGHVSRTGLVFASSASTPALHKAVKPRLLPVEEAGRR